MLKNVIIGSVESTDGGSPVDKVTVDSIPDGKLVEARVMRNASIGFGISNHEFEQPTVFRTTDTGRIRRADAELTGLLRFLRNQFDEVHTLTIPVSDDRMSVHVLAKSVIIPGRLIDYSPEVAQILGRRLVHGGVAIGGDDMKEAANQVVTELSVTLHGPDNMLAHSTVMTY